MSANPNSVTGEFHDSVKPSQPLEKGGHQMGQPSSPTSHVPTFAAQTLPTGTAPKESTYTPNPDLNNQGMYQPAANTLPGTDSKAMHTGLGHPGQGQTSSELRHDGQHHAKKQGTGTVGLNTVGQSQKELNPQDPQFANQRKLDQDYPTGARAGVGGNAGEDRIPEPAERVAAENNPNR